MIAGSLRDCSHGTWTTGRRRGRCGTGPPRGDPRRRRRHEDYPSGRRARIEPTIVAKESSWLPSLGCPVLEEPAEPRHPLTGIVAALERFEEPVVVVACDVPLLPAELLAELGHRRARFAMPIHPRPQPLVARYTPGLLPRLREALAGREPLVEVAASLGGDGLRAAELRGYGDPETMFANVNTPEDLRRANALLSAR